MGGIKDGDKEGIYVALVREGWTIDSGCYGSILRSSRVVNIITYCIVKEMTRTSCLEPCVIKNKITYSWKKGSIFFLFAINFAFTATFKPRFFPSLLVFFPRGREREREREGGLTLVSLPES